MNQPYAEVKRTTYFENLDGLRFLCFLSVFFYHSFDTQFDYIRNSSVHLFIRQDLFENGNLGVNFFFVLSGFLITYLIIEEKRLYGQISVPRFWLRRILRIWPLFYFSVFFGFVIFPLIKALFGQVSTESASFWTYLTFTNNFDVLEKGAPDASTLGALWSVAIEEQFYLVWPILLYLLPLSRYWIAFGFVILTSLLFRLTTDSLIIYHFHTLSCIGDMAIGSLGAWLITQRELFRSAMINLKRYQIVVIYLLFAFIFFCRRELFFDIRAIAVFERSLVACVMLLIILEQCYSVNSFFKLSRFKTISNLGVISYGLYCFHLIGILVAKTITGVLHFNTSVWQVVVLDTLLALTITIVISRISYQYFELPFLKLKERFAFPHRTTLAATRSPLSPPAKS